MIHLPPPLKQLGELMMMFIIGFIVGFVGPIALLVATGLLMVAIVAMSLVMLVGVGARRTRSEGAR